MRDLVRYFKNQTEESQYRSPQEIYLEARSVVTHDVTNHFTQECEFVQVKKEEVKKGRKKGKNPELTRNL